MQNDQIQPNMCPKGELYNVRGFLLLINYSSSEMKIEDNQLHVDVDADVMELKIIFKKFITKYFF